MIKPKLEIRKWTKSGEDYFSLEEGTKEKIYEYLSIIEDAYIKSLNPVDAKCLLKCTFEEGWYDNDNYTRWDIVGHFQETESLAQERLDKEMVKYNEYLDGEEERNKQKAVELETKKKDRLKNLNKEIVKMQEEILSKQELIKTLQTTWGLDNEQ